VNPVIRLLSAIDVIDQSHWLSLRAPSGDLRSPAKRPLNIADASLNKRLMTIVNAGLTIG
jgi:hypothetical protein